MDFDYRRLRLFFDETELLENETLTVGVDSYGKPLTITRSRGVKDYITEEIMRGEKDPSKPAHENTHEIWLYEGKEIDPYDNFMTFMARHMDNAFKIFKARPHSSKALLPEWRSSLLTLKPIDRKST